MGEGVGFVKGRRWIGRWLGIEGGSGVGDPGGWGLGADGNWREAGQGRWGVWGGVRRERGEGGGDWSDQE